ncbi:hypothetical protein [Marinobacter nauticus]|uniref:hypothetical protein n=1 Tax=Marinobacter nauticus TaxID=2743 RepID=UPI00404516ED
MLPRLILALIVCPLLAEASTEMPLSGRYLGQYRIVMWGCPGACNADAATRLGEGIRDVAWTWDFDEGWVSMEGTSLTVGFPYEVQDLGNESDTHNRAQVTYLGDNRYRVDHGFQIYNPNVGNPRTETLTVFEITESDSGLTMITLDHEVDGLADGIPGTQIHGVFPMTVQPQMDGWALPDNNDTSGDGLSDALKLQLGLNPRLLDTDNDGLPDIDELGSLGAEAPADSDNDGLIDALEPGDSALDPQRLAGLALLGSVPGLSTGTEPLAGEVISVTTAAPWRFVQASTDLMVQDTENEQASEDRDATLGAPGLKYSYGRIRLALEPASNAVATDSATLSITTPQPLPANDELLVYLQTNRNEPDSFKLLTSSSWQRKDDNTLVLTIGLDSEWNLATTGSNRIELTVAPTRNGLGGIERSGGAAFWIPMLLTISTLMGMNRIR